MVLNESFTSLGFSSRYTKVPPLFTFHRFCGWVPADIAGSCFPQLKFTDSVPKTCQYLADSHYHDHRCAWPSSPQTRIRGPRAVLRDGGREQDCDAQAASALESHDECGHRYDHDGEDKVRAGLLGPTLLHDCEARRECDGGCDYGCSKVRNDLLSTGRRIEPYVSCMRNWVMLM